MQGSENKVATKTAKQSATEKFQQSTNQNAKIYIQKHTPKGDTGRIQGTSGSKETRGTFRNIKELGNTRDIRQTETMNGRVCLCLLDQNVIRNVIREAASIISIFFNLTLF